MAGDPKAVGNNTELEDIAKMPINIQLLNLWISRSMGRHGAVSGFIRIIILIEVVSFCIGFEPFDNTIGILRIVFGNESLNSRSVKPKIPIRLYTGLSY